MFNCFVCTISLLIQRLIINCTAESHLYISQFVNACSVQNCTIVKMIYEEINSGLHVLTYWAPWMITINPKFSTCAPKASLLDIGNI